ncbi:MAG: hypothetical protein ACQET7_14520, partial [Thermodesulfobacteriota bacterium]
MSLSLFTVHRAGLCRLFGGYGPMWGAGFALFALISAATVLVTGCVSEERYHYRRIVSDYDRPVLADHRFDTETPAPTA